MTLSLETREQEITQEEQRYYSPEEYLELELAAQFRSQYYQGKIIPMAGGTPNHNRIAGNLYAAINFALKSKKYDVFMSDMRLWIPQYKLYTYPDVMVVADELQFAEGRKDTITNPIMIVEVLSKSTANFDTGKKFKMYRNIPTFQEYIVIDQYEMHVEQFAKKADNKWLLSEYDDKNAILELNSIEFQISLLDIYNKVEFATE